MWPSVTKNFPCSPVGNSVCTYLFIQNIGLWGVPNLIGWVLDNYCIVGNENNANLYDYTVPMFVFTGFATLSFIVAYLLKVADKKIRLWVGEAEYERLLKVGTVLLFICL